MCFCKWYTTEVQYSVHIKSKWVSIIITGTWMDPFTMTIWGYLLMHMDRERGLHFAFKNDMHHRNLKKTFSCNFLSQIIIYQS